jgi:hypothetical protein
VVRKFKNHSAPGKDNIHNLLIKNSSDNFTDELIGEMKEMFENERSSTHSLLHIEKHLEEGV